MKSLLEKILRWIGNLPVIAPIRRRIDCIIRLPDFEKIQWDINGRRDAFEAAQMKRWHDLEERLSTYAKLWEVFENEQLPALDNLIRSVPIALRAHTRDIIGVRAQLDDHMQKLGRDLIDTRAKLDNDIQTLARDLAHTLTDMQTRLNDGDSRLKDLRLWLKNTTGSVGYLLGRVEFVRRELMFEMRYGAFSPQSSDALRVKIAVVDPEKLVAARKGVLKLNLGCGHVPLDGYLNVDRRALPGVDIIAEAEELPFNPAEVDEIFSAHMLEHFPKEQFRRELLPYWYSLLKPGGIFAAIVPDADGMIKAYNGGEYAFERIREVTYGSQDYDGDFHFNMFNTTSLSELLTEAGFIGIEIVAENRENGGCKEFEIRARRPDEEK